MTARGIERRTIFADTREHEHFLELLEEMSARYGIEVHAYALMGNHYHLLIRTPRANASAAIQWLNVCYSAWFNKRRKRTGHVFQGRFWSVLIDGDGAWLLRASIYTHLNPVRTSRLGLGKAANRVEALGLASPSPESLRLRLKTLRDFRWSSFRAFAGYASAPDWLRTEELLKRAGGCRAYRRQVQLHATRGTDPEGFENLRGRLALGTREFQDRIKNLVGRVTREQPARKHLASCVSVAAIVKLVESTRGESWSDFAERHGDWGRDLALYLARKRSGLTLQQIGAKLGMSDYKTVSKAVQRFEATMNADRERQRLVQSCLDELSNVET